MNVWSWKKNKIITSGWFYYYDSDVRGNVFVSDELVITEEMAKKMSLKLLDALRLYNSEQIQYRVLLDNLEDELRMNVLNFVEIQYLRSLMEKVKKTRDEG